MTEKELFDFPESIDPVEWAESFMRKFKVIDVPVGPEGANAISVWFSAAMIAAGKYALERGWVNG